MTLGMDTVREGSARTEQGGGEGDGGSTQDKLAHVVSQMSKWRCPDRCLWGPSAWGDGRGY